MASIEVKEGFSLDSSSPDFEACIAAAVDYRGDTTIHTTDGQTHEGFLFNYDGKTLQLFLIGCETPTSLSRSKIQSIAFTGADPSVGNSWEEWSKKQEAKKQVNSPTS